MPIRINADRARLLDEVAYLSLSSHKTPDLSGKEIDVFDTYPYNPQSKTSPESAKSWSRWQRNSKVEPTSLTRKNEPIELTIVDLVVRSEGGRAYKVIDEENRQFDLREDQLLEALKHVGIAPGGHIPGKFVWGVLASQIRLVFVGGDLHSKMTQQSEQIGRAEQRKLAGLAPTESTLEVGHVYRKRDGTMHLFMGRARPLGSKKSLFAFVEVPERPHGPGSDVDDEIVADDNDHERRYKQYLKSTKLAARDWETMSLEARCMWHWSNRYHWVEEPDWGDIVLMSSPKFDEEVTGFHGGVELVAKLRQNEGARHKFVDGLKNDLAEKWYEQGLGRERNWDTPPNERDGWGQSWERREALRKEFRKKVHVEYLADRQRFNEAVVWA